MPRLAHFILVEAPIDRVFAFVSDYRNLPRMQTEFKTVRLLSAQASGLGARVEARGVFHGLPLTTQLTIVGYEPPLLLASQTSGGIRSHATWSFRAEPDAFPPGPGVRVTLVIDYTIAIPGLALLGGFVHRDLDALTMASLRRLKALVEGAATPGAGVG
ncbi:MAG: hypothetical protein DLM70_18995 [Chloroflexi bacterium]|nr:MAG: hypothetical protein DLM70_18995 [Chloroflexota bacterium]